MCETCIETAAVVDGITNPVVVVLDPEAAKRQFAFLLTTLEMSALACTNDGPEGRKQVVMDSDEMYYLALAAQQVAEAIVNITASNVELKHDEKAANRLNTVLRGCYAMQRANDAMQAVMMLPPSLITEEHTDMLGRAVDDLAYFYREVLGLDVQTTGEPTLVVGDSNG